MNVVIAGPFGHGTLSDEVVLAGLLRHLSVGKHEATVMSADPAHTQTVHDVRAVMAESPANLLSNKELWKALGKAHLLVLASGGVISGQGQHPARTWLSLLEHAQTAGLQTAVVGVGAVGISELKECARIQRLLHHCAGSVSTRDELSKLALMSYGMSANRISASGDPALALAGTIPAAQVDAHRIGVVLAGSIPARPGFGVDEQPSQAAAVAAAQELLGELLRDSAASVTLFHDATPSGRQLVEAVSSGAPAGRVATQAAECPVAEIRARMAECGALFSFSLHGLILAAGVGTPVAGCDAETGAAAFLGALGLSKYALTAQAGAFVAHDAAAALRELADGGAAVRASVAAKAAGLRKREAQNARMMDLLVPRRVAYARSKEIDATGGDDEGDGSGEGRPARSKRRGPPRKR